MMTSIACFGWFRNGCSPVLENVWSLNVCPPSMLVARKVDARVALASRRASYQVVTTVPVMGSTVTAGMNCGRFPSV